MKCEEFQAMGWDAERDASLGEAQRAAAREHASACSACAALQESWRAARAGLRAYAEETQAQQAPARIEMRLRQEFRTRHRTMKGRRAAVIAAWALATAAVVAGAASWMNWRKSQREEAARHPQTLQGASDTQANKNSAGAKGASAQNGETGLPNEDSTGKEPSGALIADNELSNFTLLPGVSPADTDDAAILRVRMQRGALGALGLPVNEERAGEWIQVDLLVGDDGLPQGVRLPQ